MVLHKSYSLRVATCERLCTQTFAQANCDTFKGFFNLLNIYATSRNINIALIKMVVPKSKTQSEDSCLNSDFSNTTISQDSQIPDNFTISNRFDWNDQEQGSILEQGILIS